MATKQNESDRSAEHVHIAQSRPMCGIVMPISPTPDVPAQHWAEVLTIIEEAILLAGFESQLVSDAEDVGIIQKRIIQNLYENPIVVCDVSSKNANVMFELGMRLAFDKPTIIIKDDETAYSFDTAPIEHLTYRRDLRFSSIVQFKQLLADKLRGTHDKANKDKSYTTFLKHFGTFKVATLDTKEVSRDDLIMEELRIMRAEIRRLDPPSNFRTYGNTPNTIGGRGFSKPITEVRTPGIVDMTFDFGDMPLAETRRFQDEMARSQSLVKISDVSNSGRTILQVSLVDNHKAQDMITIMQRLGFRQLDEYRFQLLRDAS